MNDQPAILLCGHGTTDADAIAGFEAFVAQLRARLPYRRIVHGYLELAQPSFAETIHSISMKLEEMERSTLSRLMVIKEIVRSH